MRLDTLLGNQLIIVDAFAGVSIVFRLYCNALLFETHNQLGTQTTNFVFYFSSASLIPWNFSPLNLVDYIAVL